jgi:hypothetical protein
MDGIKIKLTMVILFCQFACIAQREVAISTTRITGQIWLIDGLHIDSLALIRKLDLQRRVIRKTTITQEVHGKFAEVGRSQVARYYTKRDWIVNDKIISRDSVWQILSLINEENIYYISILPENLLFQRYKVKNKFGAVLLSVSKEVKVDE